MHNTRIEKIAGFAYRTSHVHSVTQKAFSPLKRTLGVSTSALIWCDIIWCGVGTCFHHSKWIKNVDVGKLSVSGISALVCDVPVCGRRLPKRHVNALAYNYSKVQVNIVCIIVGWQENKFALSSESGKTGCDVSPSPLPNKIETKTQRFLLADSYGPPVASAVMCNITHIAMDAAATNISHTWRVLARPCDKHKQLIYVYKISYLFASRLLLPARNDWHYELNLAFV